MFTRRWFIGWGAWCSVVFILLNGNSSHTEADATGHWLLSGQWTVSVSMVVRSIRGAWVNGGDICRYMAYANAALGRPYQGYYIQPLETWRVDESILRAGKDPETPGDIPLVTPPHRVVPWRDFSSEHLPIVFALAVPPALLTDDPDRYRLLFSLLMGALLTAALGVVVRIGAHLLAPAHVTAVVPWAALMAVAAGTILVRRYDAAVSLGLCLLVWGCVVRKPVIAGLGLGPPPPARGFQLWRRRSRCCTGSSVGAFARRG
jgi:hypothetical protein